VIPSESFGCLTGRSCVCAGWECKSPAEHPLVTHVLFVRNLVVEAAGVELFSVLTTRKLLILGTATTAKKAPLPDPLYVYCTKTLPL